MSAWFHDIINIEKTYVKDDEWFGLVHRLLEKVFG
jgi:hypothetical protein